MNPFLAIFIGGGLGSLLRYGISRWFESPAGGFPVATFAANMCACFILGLIWGYFARRPDLHISYGLLLMTGFCGGFSTFSTFGLETVSLIQLGQPILALGYVMASVLLGALLVFSAMWMVA